MAERPHPDLGNDCSTRRRRLFYSQGASVGVDALLKEANVARRSLYEHFGGKDGLVEAVLRRASEEDLAWYEGALAGEPEPRARLLGLFDRLDELVSSADFRGCRYFATDLAFADPAIRRMRRRTRSGGGSAHSSCGSSRRWAMPTRSTLPSSCTC